MDVEDSQTERDALTSWPSH